MVLGSRNLVGHKPSRKPIIAGFSFMAIVYSFVQKLVASLPSSMAEQSPRRGTDVRASGSTDRELVTSS